MDLKTCKPSILGGVLAVVLVGTLMVAEAPQSSLLQRSGAQSRLPRGAVAPAFQLPRIQGGVLELNELQGASSVLVFVTPTCPYCTELKQSLIDQGLPNLRHRLVFISRGSKALDERPAEVQALDAHIASRFPVLQDTTGRVSEAYKVMSVPTTYLLDGEGEVVASEVGVSGGLELVQELVAELSERR